MLSDSALCRYYTKSLISMTSLRTAVPFLPTWIPGGPLPFGDVFPPSGMSLTLQQANGTWITTLGGEDCEDQERSILWLVCCRPLITRDCWEGQGHQLWLWAMGKTRAPQPLASPIVLISAPRSTHSWKKRRERLVPVAEVCSLMARNQTCHM